MSTIGNLSTANTFQEWLSATSTLVTKSNALTDNIGGAGFLANTSLYIEGTQASLNVRTLANINTLQANTGNIANISFATSNLYITPSGSIIGGNIAIAQVTSNAYIGGDTFISGNLIVSGNVTLDAIGFDELSIAGGASIGTVLNVAQGSTLSGDVLGGNVSLTGNITTGNATVTTYASLATVTFASGNITVPSNVTTGNVTVTSNLNVQGNTITSYLVVGTNATISNVVVTTNTVTGNILVTRNATVNGNIATVNVTSNLAVGANASVFGNLTVSGNSTLSNANINYATANTLILTASLGGAVNTAIYSTISAAIDSSIAFAIALG
jgi:hypothetical protein